MWTCPSRKATFPFMRFFIFIALFTFVPAFAEEKLKSKPIIEYRDCEFPPGCEVIRIFEDGRVGVYSPARMNVTNPPSTSFRGYLLQLDEPLLRPLLKRVKDIKSRKLLPSPTQDRNNGQPWHQELRIFDAKLKARTVLEIAANGKYFALEEWQVSRVFGMVQAFMHMARTQAAFESSQINH